MSTAAQLLLPLNTLQAVALSAFFSFLFVGSLYLWKSTTNRNDPVIIKKRTVSVLLVCALLSLVLYNLLRPEHRTLGKLVHVLGLRCNGLLSALVLPLLLTVLLFLGPLSVNACDGQLRSYFTYWKHHLRDPTFVRNIIIAPISEEFVYRGCILPLLSPRWASGAWSVLICPLFFGLSHFHHIIEHVWQGSGLGQAFIAAAFQFTYTTIFGAYSTFLVLRSGHLVSAVMVHAFCNFMGFPDLMAPLAFSRPLTRVLLMGAHVLGLVGWLWLLRPLTQPQLYSNQLYDCQWSDWNATSSTASSAALNNSVM